MSLNKILSLGQGGLFYRFGNADGKRWIVPTKNMRVALNLYQPSSAKGKLVKALLPLLHRLPIVRKTIKAESLNCSLNQELQGTLHSLFGTEALEFSIFEGTPCVHQKITIQLSRENHILGYCKVSDNGEILSLFERESTILHTLAQRGVTGIPQALFCGTLSNGVHIFVQSTVKTTQSKVVHRRGTLQEEFLFRLHEKTRQTIPFEQSDYYLSLTALQEHLYWLPANIDRIVVTTAVAGIMEKFCGKMVEFSACHGDFTPWNMFVEKGELFAFDFEYASLTYPAGLDLYHFELQTMRLEQRKSNNEIIELYKNKKENKLTLYLLSIIAQYVLREKGVYDESTIHAFDLWVKLIENNNKTDNI